MKKLFFTLMMMAGLALVAGTTMAVNETTVYQGGTYSYQLDGVESTNDATVTVTSNATNIVIAETGTTWSITGGAAASSVTFDVTYENVAGDIYTSVGTVVFTVLVTDDNTNCANSIELDVTVQAAPSLVIQITGATGGGCQTIGTPDNNVDAVANGGPHSNSIAFTVSRESGVDLDDVASLGYDINISESTGASDQDLIAAGDEGDQSKLTLGDHTITFNSSEGGGSTVTATLQTGGTFTLDDDNGGGTYDITLGTITSDNVTINPLPTIGGFNL